LSELPDADGGTIAVEPTVTPAVKIEFIIDQNSFTPRSVAVTYTDPANIAVFPVDLNTNRPGLQFTDTANDWRVQGGPDPDPNSIRVKSKLDTIEYRAVARDPQNNQLIARIKDFEVILRPGAVTSTNQNEPARALVSEVVSDENGDNIFGSGVRMNVFKSTDAGETLRVTRTFPPRSEIQFRKDVQPEPGADPNSVAEIEQIQQHVSLVADEEVGRVPGTIEPAGGGQTPVEYCALHPGHQMFFGVDPISLSPSQSPAIGSGSGFGIGTLDPVTADDFTWHNLAPRLRLTTGGTTLDDHFVDLDPSIPPLQDPNNTIEVVGFDSTNFRLGLIAIEREPLFFSPVDAAARLVDLDTGQAADIARLFDTVGISLGLYDITALGKMIVADDGIVTLGVELSRFSDPRVRPSVVKKDASGISNGSPPTLVDSFVPGDMLDTDMGPLALGTFVELAGGNSATGGIAFTSDDPATGASVLFVLDHGLPARLAAATGDPAGGGRTLFSLPTTVSLNGAGDAAGTVTTVDPNASIPVLTRRPLAALFPATGGIEKVVERGDPVPGTPNAFVETPFTVATNDSGAGMVEIQFQDGNGNFPNAILGFNYDPVTGLVTLDNAPLIQSGDTVNANGTLRVVGSTLNDISIGPKSLGDDALAISVVFTDGARAVLVVPMGTPAAPTVPDVVGLLQIDAVPAIMAAGLALGNVVFDFSYSVPADAVISQFPAPNTAAAPGDPVNLVISLGRLGDIDGDGDVDMNDLNLMRPDRNKPVTQSVCGARCDLNFDATIDALDMRIMVTSCTRPRCAI